MSHAQHFPYMGGYPNPDNMSMAQQNPTGIYPTTEMSNHHPYIGMAQGYTPGAAYPQSAMAYPNAYNVPAYIQQPQQNTSILGNDRFIKGVLIGTAATYLLTNESVQQSAIKAAVKVWSMIQGGVEEIKERFHDAEAELHAARMDEE